ARGKGLPEGCRSRESSRPTARPSARPGVAPVGAPDPARGHDRPTRGAAAGARRPRMKKKTRCRSARSEELTLSEEATGSEATQSEKATLGKEMSRSQEVTREKEATRSKEVTRAEMATAGLTVTVTHSNEKHDLHVTPQQGSSEPLVQDLAQAVVEATGVPLSFQKLIFKGKSLKEMESPLTALGIQDGCRVMLIGKKNRGRKVEHWEKSVEKIADQLEELNKELTGIHICKLKLSANFDRKVRATIEQFMKILEETDTLILPENFKDSRLKRKGLVKKVQAFLAECDTVEQNICQETEWPQSTNFALAE
uniref:BAG family molecular chaperone regulator 1 n=1 Tax=Cebus imitator TaxID=2715852 RepID=A0A2K5RWT3_CEBIM